MNGLTVESGLFNLLFDKPMQGFKVNEKFKFKGSDATRRGNNPMPAINYMTWYFKRNSFTAIMGIFENLGYSMTLTLSRTERGF
jgi:hypothetical protein